MAFLDDLFVRYGIPDTFTLKELKKFCKIHAMKHLTTQPYHPRSKGLAERFVDTLKRALKKSRNELLADTALTQFLSVYLIMPNPKTISDEELEQAIAMKLMEEKAGVFESLSDLSTSEKELEMVARKLDEKLDYTYAGCSLYPKAKLLAFYEAELLFTQH
ncbi:uncharacterized protein K02A2.6-like [Octopus sinensis]|uniref:Uncharacterized protein K02A2.6-like n=1 Tax=Octopus sinensis TaxID=2607531 RepID=A0A6P7SNQ8_9MOLL|nr:uncharacterized protein K02A2.6-like [Octopus sinensis]